MVIAINPEMINWDFSTSGFKTVHTHTHTCGCKITKNIIGVAKVIMRRTGKVDNKENIHEGVNWDEQP